jgi:hypothetical protein
VNLSFRVDAALKEQIRKSLETDAPEGALARSPDLEFDVYRRLYSDPEYLAFVKRVLDAKGSYISPVVRDFLSFYARCLNIKLNEYARDEQIDPDTLRKRLEGILGREKGTSYYFLDYYELTILGHVRKGKLSADQRDPDSTGHSFKVDPRTDLQAIVVSEIEDDWQRFLVRKFVEHTFNIHHNIKSVQFIDEVHRQEDIPSSLSRAVRRLSRRLRRRLLSPAALERIQQAEPGIRGALLSTAVAVVILTFLAGIALLVSFYFTLPP